MPLPYIEAFAAAAHGCLGENGAARARLEAVVAAGADGGRALAFAMLELARILRTSRDQTGAEAWAQQAQAIGRRMAIPHVIALSNETLGRVAAGRGEWTEAESRLHEALATMVDRELRFYTPQVLDALAEVAAGLGSHAEAARILGAACRMRADLGLARWAPDEPSIAALGQALREELGEEGYDAAYTEAAALSTTEAVAWLRRARGERRRPARGWESLTPTELRVVELVTEGLTNPQIGERMFITRGTVKVHLAHVFGKLDVATRAELAAAATRRRASA